MRDRSVFGVCSVCCSTAPEAAPNIAHINRSKTNVLDVQQVFLLRWLAYAILRGHSARISSLLLYDKGDVAMRILLIGLIVLCTGCSTISSKMGSYVGSHRDELIQRWGPPSQETALTNGGRSLLYVSTWGDWSGVYTCRQVFNTDAGLIIRSWHYSGC